MLLFTIEVSQAKWCFTPSPSQVKGNVHADSCKTNTIGDTWLSKLSCPQRSSYVSNLCGFVSVMCSRPKHTHKPSDPIQPANNQGTRNVSVTDETGGMLSRPLYIYTTLVISRRP